MQGPVFDPFAKWNLLARFLSATGTIFVAIVAIWGAWIRSKLVPAKLRLSIHNAKCAVTRFTQGVVEGAAFQYANGPRVIFYHLKVSNSRRWSPAANCRVVLKEIYRRGPD